MKKVYVSPSLLSADFLYLEKEIRKAEKSGAEYLHFDVMDGHFVNNISFGVPVLKSISHSHHMINDVHIMISDPKRYAEAFIKAGADVLTFHYEACKDDNEVQEVIDLIKELGAKPGISIKPNTSVDKVLPFMKDLYLVLIMSVEPGFGGQSFIECSLDKISYLSSYIKTHNYQTLIEVDGGINKETSKKCVDAGVDILVAGSYLFGHEDMEERIKEMKQC
ncbi:MAG: ribulose-phosphate 3-epimerase [Bacilli bacterium]|nr:ribulose-phosphate 3-epimerase [Bacilli bacterium]